MGMFGGGGGGLFGGAGIPGLDMSGIGNVGTGGGTVFGSIGDAITGTAQNAGLLGVGQFKGSGIGIDPAAFQSSANQ